MLGLKVTHKSVGLIFMILMGEIIVLPLGGDMLDLTSKNYNGIILIRIS